MTIPANKITMLVSEEWKRNRTRTLITYVLQYFTIGIERSSNGVTLWIYLTTLLKCENPELFYGIITLVYFVPPALFSMLVARFADRTRRIKLIMVICNFISMVGCIIYVIPISAYYPLVGQALLGFNLILKPLTSAEIARSYAADEMKNKMPIMMAFYFVGYAFGPLIGEFFQHLDIVVFGLRITIGNISGIVSLIFIILTQISVILLASDLSKEFDLKEATGREKVKPQGYEKETSLFVLKKVVQTFDVFFLMIMTIVSSFFQVTFVRSFPVIVGLLQLPYYFITICYISYSITLFGIIFGLISTSLQHKSVYIAGVGSVLFVFISGSFQALLIKGQLSLSSKIAFTILLAVCITLAEIGEQVFLIIVSAKVVSSKHQAYIEGIRGMLRCIGSILAGLVTGYIVAYCYPFLVGLTFLCFIQIVILILRRKTFENPDILI